MRRTVWAFLLTASLLLAACGASHPRSSPTTSPTTRPRPKPATTTTSTTVAPTTTTTAPDPDVVPAVITPAYVDAVFVVLNHIWDNSLRTELTAANVSPQAVADLRSIFNDPLYVQELKIATQELPGGISNVRNPPGDQVTKVTQLISFSPKCIFVKTKTNVAAVVEKPPPQGYDYFELVRKQPGIDPGHINPTPWAINYDLFFNGSGPKTEKDPCPGS